MTGTQIQCARLLTRLRWLSPYSSNHRSMLRIVQKPTPASLAYQLSGAQSQIVHHQNLTESIREHQMHHKRSGFMFASCVAALALSFIGPARSQSIALTFDDGPDMSDEIGMTAAQRNEAILAALRAEKIKSVLFVTRTDKDERRIALVAEWGLQGHLIGNHTATHPNFGDNNTSLRAFEAELLQCEAAL